MMYSKDGIIRERNGRFSSFKRKLLKLVDRVILLVAGGIAVSMWYYYASPLMAGEPEQVVVTEYVHVYDATSTPSILLKIAECESNSRQFNEDGTVVVGKQDSDDRGMWQINRRIWQKQLRAMDLNVDTYEDNLTFALYLYENFGTEPWFNSKKCWSK